MDKKRHIIWEIVLIGIAIFFFGIMLPGLTMSAGTFGNAYLDGLNELSPYGLKAGFVAITMIILSYLACYLLKLNNEFITGPLKATCTGIIILPLAKGALNFFSDFSKDSRTVTSSYDKVLGNFNIFNEGLIKFIMHALPVVLCVSSIIYILIKFIGIFKERYFR
ncbi:hypothetical protein GAT24_03140 [Salmonella enterica]|nr:hypothetical protein [Salmonella enterica]EDC5629760.1 hypothetical protein [Salmonella enterica]EDC5634157.1 hypothetical protein [Salmonella enterica]EKY5338409.1 hypothetical protein [Salmonella enterica]EKY5343227.1 hypothetical protein [Salmonella enterica]